PDVFINLGTLGSGDTEDPTLAGNGHLYVLNGEAAQIFDIDPVDGDFSNGVTITDFVIPPPTSGTRPEEWEGLAFDAASGHLLAGAQDDNVIYEIAIPATPDDPSAFVQIHDATGIAGLDQISGLAVGAADTYWIADRGSLGDPESVDGQIHQVTFGPVPPAAPVAKDQSVSTAPSQPIQITLVATDVNGQDLTYSIVSPPGAGTGTLGTLTGNTVTYNPGSFTGQTNFTFRANDGVSGFSNTATVTIDVQANQQPVIDSITPKVIAEGSQLNFTATATDPNAGQTLSFSEAGDPWPAGAVLGANGVFQWVPTEAEGPGIYDLTIRVTDNGSPAEHRDVVVNITVNEVNQAPVVISPGNLGPHAETEQVDVTVGGSDPDRPIGTPANTLTWSATGLPTGLSINPSTGKITGTVAVGATAGSPYSVTVKAEDNGSPKLSDTVVFQWTTTNSNLSPVLGAIGNRTATQGAQLSFTATATDPDGDGLTFSLTSPPSGAAITSGGTFTWTPSQAPGDYPVTVKVTDNGSPVLSDQETFIVTVEAEPNPDPSDPFTDDDGHIFENAIQWLAGEGITQGCNPPANDHFCPDDHVTRGQMAAFLVRAQSLPGYSGPDRFRDDDG
ncbi:MAG: putative Ig domain-containing protein, partial [Acidimicrobiia bacterium]